MGNCLRRQPPLARGSVATSAPSVRVARLQEDSATSSGAVETDGGGGAVETSERERPQPWLEPRTKFSVTVSSEEDLTYSTESTFLISRRNPGAGSVVTRCSASSMVPYTSRTPRDEV